MDDPIRPRRVLNYRTTPDGHITSDIAQPCCVPVLLANREGRSNPAHAGYCPVFQFVGFQGDVDPSPRDDSDEPA